MLRALLRFVLLSIVFFFVYRFLREVWKAFIGESKEPPQSFDAPQQPPSKKSVDYKNVKNATFKDLPDNSSKK